MCEEKVLFRDPRVANVIHTKCYDNEVLMKKLLTHCGVWLLVFCWVPEISGYTARLALGDSSTPNFSVDLSAEQF